MHVDGELATGSPASCGGLTAMSMGISSLVDVAESLDALAWTVFRWSAGLQGLRRCEKNDMVGELGQHRSTRQHTQACNGALHASVKSGTREQG